VHRGSEDAATALTEQIADAGGKAARIRADLRDAHDLDRVFAEAEELGPVLGLVNNAGVRADNLALSITDDEWDLVVDTNLSAAFRLTRRAMRSMLRARFGRIVNVASVVGPRANPGQANYAASKAGLIGMTKTVAAEVARKGVTVNAVAPGFIATDMTKDLSPRVLEAVPARRAGHPDEVAACVRFLASDAAAYVTGTTLYVDGGMSA
jgi:3-oxoacyl-[acyl-carrier protein] reductase